jgi:hypothetical protein
MIGGSVENKNTNKSDPFENIDPFANCEEVYVVASSDYIELEPEHLFSIKPYFDSRHKCIAIDAWYRFQLTPILMDMGHVMGLYITENEKYVVAVIKKQDKTRLVVFRVEAVEPPRSYYEP